MHSKKIGTVFSIGLIHRFFVRLINSIGLIGHMDHMGQLFFNKADIAAAFHAREPNFRKVINLAVETHVFLEIVN